MLSDVVRVLACPVCGTGLDIVRGSVRCSGGHSFDVARQGYVNLLPGDTRAGTADTAAMVGARVEFLSEGHFASLAALLAERVATFGCDPDCVLDAGAGTGYFLAAVLDRSSTTIGVALDISKFASRRSAQAHPRIGTVVCDLWHGLPVRSGIADAVINVFAPRNPAEFQRVLRPDGALLVVTPTSRHLCELVPTLGLLAVGDEKTQNVDAALSGHFSLAGREEHEAKLLLTHTTAETAARMGPSAWHRTAADIQDRLTAVPDPVPVTASFTLSVYRPGR